MKTKKRIPLILTAALALSACASAANSATAAAAAETPESTAESAIEPGTEAVETDTLYGLNYSYSQSVVYEDLPTLDDEWNFAGTNVYKNDLNAGQTTLIYHCDDWCLADPYVTSDAVYLLTYNRDRDTKSLPCRRMVPKLTRFPLTHTPRPLSYTATVIFIAWTVMPPMIPQAGSALTCRPARQRPGTCPSKQSLWRTPPGILP